MPIRFRRTLKIGPGVRLNFSKSGVSTTVGPKGFHYTFGKHGVRRTIDLPGTGLYETDYIKKNGESEEEKEERKEKRREARGQRSEGKSGSSKRTRRRETAAAASTGLRNAFLLLGVVVFFFAGAAVLGLIPAGFVGNSLQFLVNAAQSAGH